MKQKKQMQEQRNVNIVVNGIMQCSQMKHQFVMFV